MTCPDHQVPMLPAADPGWWWCAYCQARTQAQQVPPGMPCTLWGRRAWTDTYRTHLGDHAGRKTGAHALVAAAGRGLVDLILLEA